MNRLGRTCSLLVLVVGLGSITTVSAQQSDIEKQLTQSLNEHQKMLSESIAQSLKASIKKQVTNGLKKSAQVDLKDSQLIVKINKQVKK